MRYEVTVKMPGDLFVSGHSQQVITYDGPSLVKALFSFLRAGGETSNLRRYEAP